MHRHKWEIVEKEILESKAEALYKSTKTYKGHVPYDFFDKDVLVTSKCIRCGTEKVQRI